ncbi:MAG: hypothetical protein LQ344_005483 [Seirophora lacunosa]|nr:MAG: hypothetical protein LQ344_005483 [Seirophora lacunosa]
MFAGRNRVFSDIHRQCTARLGLVQRRWAQVEDVRFLVTHQRTDKIAEKYRDKLQRKAREEGLQSIDELKAAYKERAKERNTTATTSPHTVEQPASPFPSPPPAPVPSQHLANHSSSSTSKASAPPGLKTLSSYLDLDKIRALSPKEIEYIWRLRHASSPTSLCAILPSSSFTRMIQTARKHPHFILPLPREGSAGAEIHFLQFSFPAPDTVTVVFTHLAEYKLQGEFSQPHTTITLHSELMQEKGLVLMQGQVVDGRGVTVDEARWLVLCLQKFYSIDSGDHSGRGKLLEMFSKGDGAFRVEELVEEAEKMV